MTEPILEADGLVKDYRMGESRLRVLHGVDLTVARGEFLCVLGPSGSGKSTLLHLLGLLDKPTDGRVRFEGADAFARPKRWRDRLRNQAIGFVFQFYHLMPDLTVLGNTLLPAMIQAPAALWPARRGGERTRAMEVLERLGLSERVRHLPRELSGGVMGMVRRMPRAESYSRRTWASSRNTFPPYERMPSKTPSPYRTP